MAEKQSDDFGQNIQAAVMLLTSSINNALREMNTLSEENNLLRNELKLKHEELEKKE